MAWTPRQHPRFRANLAIELRRQGSGTPVRGQTADISMGGCYLEIMLTQQISTELGITLWIGDKKICGSGVVVSRHPNFGNGIKFTFLDEEGKRLLNEYLATLSPFRCLATAR
jgi:PilZ domain-containing protein